MKIMEDEMSHPSHPEHKLKMESTEVPFMCDGCKEPGIGLKYTCATCNFDLHEGCALARATIPHALYKNCKFVFHSVPPAPTDGRICDACGKKVVGFVYHCEQRDLDLHPCCAKLPLRFSHEDLTFSLRKEASSACYRCGEKGWFWFYRSDCKTCYVHVSCVKDMLSQRWQTVYLNRNRNGNSSNDEVGQIQTTTIPILEGVLQNYPRERVGTRLQRFCQIVGGALRIIIAAILGDPTAIIATVIQALISNR